MVQNQYGCIMADAMGLGKVRDVSREEMRLLNGPLTDPSMHRSPVDPPQAISSRTKANNREVHHRMPVKFGQELGQRTRCV